MNKVSKLILILAGLAATITIIGIIKLDSVVIWTGYSLFVAIIWGGLIYGIVEERRKRENNKDRISK